MKDTVTYKGFTFEYNIYHQPEEPEVRYYPDGSGYPGCSEEFEITGITLNGVDASELLENQIDEFEEYIINEFKNQNPY